MTEQEYTDATQLARVRLANQILREVFPLKLNQNDPEYKKVMRILQKWENDLYKLIKVTPTEE